MKSLNTNQDSEFILPYKALLCMVKGGLPLLLLFSVFSTNAQSLQWVNPIGGVWADFVTQTEVDGVGNIYVTGTFTDTVDFDPSNGVAKLASVRNGDAFLAKYDAQGDYVFAFGLGTINGVYGNTIAVDSIGNIFLAIVIYGSVDFDPSAGSAIITTTGTSLVLAKYDSMGNYINAFRVADCGSSVLVWDMAMDARGSVYLSGNFDGTTDFGNGNVLTPNGGYDIFLAKYDSQGNNTFAISMGGISYEGTLSIALGQNNEVFMTGIIGSDTVDFDPSPAINNIIGIHANSSFLAKYDSLGNYEYAIGLVGTQRVVGYSVAVDNYGNAHVFGEFSGSVDFDPSADSVHLIAVGGSSSFFLAKYDPAGNYLYAFNITTDTTGGVIEAGAVTIDARGSAFITGSFGGGFDFDPFSSKGSLLADYRAVFLAEYDSLGHYRWASTIGNLNASGFGADMNFDNQGNLLLAGNFQNSFDFDPSADSVIHSSQGGRDGFFAKYAIPLFIGIEEYRINSISNSHFDLFPNPTDGVTAIHLVDGGQAQLKVLDFSGRLLQSIDFESKTEINLRGFRQGVYLIKVTISGETYTRKVVKE